MKFISFKNHPSSKGFTIIETLVAVTILMIAITGPLTIAHRSLLAATYASQQVTASYLAQDAIEFVKNVRDNNRLKSEDGGTDGWLNGLSECTKEKLCSIDTLTGNPAIPSGIAAPCLNSCKLYKGSSGYTPDSSNAAETLFTRYFYLSYPGGDVGSDQVKMTVVVSWKGGTIQNVMAFETQIFDIFR